MVKITSTAVSVKMVPPTVIATASFLVMPNRPTTGYESNVWVENILAVSNEA